MSTEQNKIIARKIFAGLNDHDLEEVVSYYTDDTRFTGWGPQVLDCQGYQETMSALLDAFPDGRFEVEDIVADGDKVVVRHSLHGTHQGSFQGIPASGRQVVVKAMAMLRMENGKATELWLNADFLGLMQQLGVIPVPEFAQV